MKRAKMSFSNLRMWFHHIPPKLDETKIGRYNNRSGWNTSHYVSFHSILIFKIQIMKRYIIPSHTTDPNIT
jgi:hypothetical protein